MVSRPSARISRNHSATDPHIRTLLRLYLWHWLKNGFLQFEENVNREGRREGEKLGEGKEPVEELGMYLDWTLNGRLSQNQPQRAVASSLCVLV